MGDSFVGIQARLMSQALRKLTRRSVPLEHGTRLHQPAAREDRCHVRQSRDDARRPRRSSSPRCLDIRRVETIKTGTESVGNRVRVKVVKNKVAPPFRVAEFDVMYGEGVSKEGGLLDVGVAMDVVTKTGAWFNFGETRLGQGREAAKEFLKTSPRSPVRSSPASAGRSTRRPFPSKASRKPNSSPPWRLPASLPPREHSRTPVRSCPCSRPPCFQAPGGRLRTCLAGRRPTPGGMSGGQPWMIPRSCWMRRHDSSRRGRGPSPEVRRRLTTAGYRGELVDGAISRLSDSALLDDEVFARAWVESRDRARPRASMRYATSCASRASTDRSSTSSSSGDRATTRPRRRIGRRRNGSSKSTRARSVASPIRGGAGARVRPAGPQRVRPRDVP